jgi:hypothetical protein
MRPERAFRTVKVLDRCRAPGALRCGRADLVAAIELVEEQLLGAGVAGRWTYPIGAVVVIALDDVEQVLGGRVLVREDVNPVVRVMGEGDLFEGLGKLEVLQVLDNMRCAWLKVVYAGLAETTRQDSVCSVCLAKVCALKLEDVKKRKH